MDQRALSCNRTNGSPAQRQAHENNRPWYGKQIISPDSILQIIYFLDLPKNIFKLLLLSKFHFYSLFEKDEFASYWFNKECFRSNKRKVDDYIKQVTRYQKLNPRFFQTRNLNVSLELEFNRKDLDSFKALHNRCPNSSFYIILQVKDDYRSNLLFPQVKTLCLKEMPIENRVKTEVVKQVAENFPNVEFLKLDLPTQQLLDILKLLDVFKKVKTICYRKSLINSSWEVFGADFFLGLLPKGFSTEEFKKIARPTDFNTYEINGKDYQLMRHDIHNTVGMRVFPLINQIYYQDFHNNGRDLNQQEESFFEIKFYKNENRFIKQRKQRLLERIFCKFPFFRALLITDEDNKNEGYSRFANSIFTSELKKLKLVNYFPPYLARQISKGDLFSSLKELSISIPHKGKYFNNPEPNTTLETMSIESKTEMIINLDKIINSYSKLKIITIAGFLCSFHIEELFQNTSLQEFNVRNNLFSPCRLITDHVSLMTKQIHESCLNLKIMFFKNIFLHKSEIEPVLNMTGKGIRNNKHRIIIKSKN
ncbi:hypothetical protein ACFLZV_06335 [Candidatus Margulisiibacteriota bacterium]